MNTEKPERFEGCTQELQFSLTAKPDGPNLPDAELSFSLVKIADRVEILTAYLCVPSNDVEGDADHFIFGDHAVVAEYADGALRSVEVTRYAMPKDLLDLWEFVKEGDDALFSAAVCTTMRLWGDIELSISSRAAKFAQQTEELRTFMQKTFSSSRQRKWEDYPHESHTDQTAWK